MLRSMNDEAQCSLLQGKSRGTALYRGGRLRSPAPALVRLQPPSFISFLTYQTAVQIYERNTACASLRPKNTYTITHRSAPLPTYITLRITKPVLPSASAATDPPQLRECGVVDNVVAAGGLEGKLSSANFSVGEAQLFVLARTILQAGGQRGGVVLLDEATSSIDVATEKKIMALIAEKLQGKTIISVLHRLEAALEYDRIVVLENGKVAHFGTPAEALRDSELFSTMRKA
ncbi:hypothetical protein O1611_g4894 [Lasiodiplodia mahajangana]|uniref:Uncharacterized protein n=1 Tax=Lasiodiplodia mahajangana TaxID=1108764 RepID=A0ACC2JN17_9PEZI|nr:hypothetical protein O1611_g4894 [Lasiodiplodia mahajangana]